MALTRGVVVLMPLLEGRVVVLTLVSVLPTLEGLVVELVFPLVITPADEGRLELL